jgi:hypothetical protein
LRYLRTALKAVPFKARVNQSFTSVGRIANGGRRTAM